MATTIEKTKPAQSTAVALTAPRLPWNPAIGAKFGLDADAWRVLTDAVYPAAKTTGAVELALSYCKARKLDPFKHPVHVVPIWSKEKNEYIETVWPGIAEHRTTAVRTGQYGGADAAEFGPTITQTFEGETKKGIQKITVRFPEWCQITLYRLTNGQRLPVPGPRVYWLETYSHMGRTDLPNDMWVKRPSGQLEKCAEAGALRKAFPEELGGELTAEEAEGLDMEAPRDITPPKPQRSDFKPATDEGKMKMAEATIAGEGRAAHDPATGELPLEPNDASSWEAWCKAAKGEIDALQTTAAIDEWSADNADRVTALAKFKKPWAERVVSYMNDRREALAGGADGQA
jgi:phage recombination protein Bet